MNYENMLCAFNKNYFASLFYYLVYFCYYLWGYIALFDIIHEFQYIISTNFYFYLQ